VRPRRDRGHSLVDQGGRVRHDSHDGHTLGKPGLEEGGGDAGGQGHDQLTRLHGRGDLVEDSRHVLRLHDQRDRRGTGRGTEVVGDGDAVPLGQLLRALLALSLKVEPAAATAQKGYYRLQVAALRDERQAQDLARQLERISGQPGEAFFDAGIDLYRVRIGHYPTREAAEADMRRLGANGVTGAFVVNEGAAVSAPALRLTQGQTATVYNGRWLSVAPVGEPSVRVKGKRYRGRILVFLNDRGSLNLINELPVEDYLRGVVPSEMGPELYNQLEALKAQAVAARTYTLRNMGEFSREGYDICATPRCQVYGGIAVEHPLSDQAVLETAGQVLLYKGELVNALYSSTVRPPASAGAARTAPGDRPITRLKARLKAACDP